MLLKNAIEKEMERTYQEWTHQEKKREAAREERAKYIKNYRLN